MKKLLTTTLLALSMTASSVHAIPIISGSKYPIIIHSFKGDIGCETALRRNGMFEKIKEGVSGVVEGCEATGGVKKLQYKGAKQELSAGNLIIAYKDSSSVLLNKGTLVNFAPAIFTVPQKGSVILITRKIVLGMGDLGLKAEFKK